MENQSHQFHRESGLKAKDSPQKIDHTITSDSLSVDSSVVDKPLTKPHPIVNQAATPVNNPSPVVNQPVDQTGEIISLHREMITAFKEQIHVKDEQIRELTKQNRAASELNLRLNSALLQQGDEIKNLLQLTGGKMDFGDGVNHNGHAVNKTVNQSSVVDNEFVDETNNGAPPQVSMAA